MESTSKDLEIFTSLAKDVNLSQKCCYTVNVFFRSIAIFFHNHPLLKYSLKRIFISLIIFFIGLSIVFVMIRASINEIQFLPDAASKQQ